MVLDFGDRLNSDEKVGLAICNIEDKRARERFKDAQKKGRTPRAGAGSHLVEGAGTNGWKQALQQLAMAYPERIEPYLTLMLQALNNGRD